MSDNHGDRIQMHATKGGGNEARFEESIDHLQNRVLTKKVREVPTTRRGASSSSNTTALGAGYVGLDIGGTGIKGGLVDVSSGELLGSGLQVPTPVPATPGSIINTIAEMIRHLESSPSAPPPSTPIGVALPAIVQRGLVRSAANIDPSWIGLDVERFMSERLDRPVKAINDADAAGLAEARYGAGRGNSGTVLVITLGTGIGSALIVGQELVPNLELGHLEIDGFKAESRASAVAREREDLSWPDYSERLQRYLAHLEFLVSPDLIIVGGGISARSEDFVPRLNLRTPVVPARLRNTAGTVGAAAQMFPAGTLTALL
ncbi:ROK family protein [Pseudarthrobacter sp. AL07]|uniref:polyphosphate--glucose phosphotransferase n=1 Tax=unclassified Pseudarthrobacter TaxID=2647000 RepID=UPI00249AE596|nr:MULTISPECIES: ROK family protein [unclassified Pseudarthrobacter]MDI3196123.1 ROK family protein [Pseudarthrobacter sp. AL20]MDI3210194.1 ROK family protein [Pseudarthrobacter sp. AL07]